MSNYVRTTTPRSADLARNLVRKGRSVRGAHNRENGARDDYRHVIRPSSSIIFLRRTLASVLEDDPSSAGRTERICDAVDPREEL